MHAKLCNEQGKVKEVKVGFSWTTFFFGCLVPLVRGDIKWFLIMLGISAVLTIATMGIGTLIFDIAMGFFYNKLYVQELLKKGYKPATEVDETALKSKEYID